MDILVDTVEWLFGVLRWWQSMPADLYDQIAIHFLQRESSQETCIPVSDDATWLMIALLFKEAS